jgi:carboxypeptidase C (cathepsin A)
MAHGSKSWGAIFALLIPLTGSWLAAQPPAAPPASPPPATPGAAAPVPGAPPAAPKPEAKPPEERTSRTQHSIELGGRELAYTATAGTLIIKAEDGTPKASFFYVAYTKDGVKDPGTRPVTFSFNGGPGSAALWVHIGAFGPRVVARDEEGMGLPLPGHLVDNENTLLDISDLVFLDPVSTGFSRAAPGQDPKQFHGVREDVESVGEMIRLWIARNQRWASPKFLAGESYGTTRAAGLADFLEQRYGMALNGVVLISSILNWQDQDMHPGNDLPYVIHLPTYAATAWFHKKLPAEYAGDQAKLLREVEDFARNEYASALMQGDLLPPERQKAVAEKVARYTGLSVDYVLRSNLRIDIYRFLKELLRGERKTVGRLDSRFTGSDLDAAGEQEEYDPSSESVDAPYTMLMQDYLRRDLGFQEDMIYERLNGKVFPWSWKGFENQYVNVAEPLRQAMVRNRALRVFMAAGVYDFATPYFDAFYTVDHLGLPADLRGHIEIERYQAGHMMYIRKADHRKLKSDLAAFYAEALR